MKAAILCIRKYVAEHGVGCELVSTDFPLNREKYREFPDFSPENRTLERETCAFSAGCNE
jgi:hypothetical protein